MDKNYIKELRLAFPQVEKMSYKELEGELKDLQSFLNDDSSAIGQSDMHYENAIIAELARRDNK